MRRDRQLGSARSVERVASVSDGQQAPSDLEQRAMRRDALRRLAQDETGLALPEPPPDKVKPGSMRSARPARRRAPWRALALVALLVVVAAGAFAVIHARPPSPTGTPRTSSSPPCAQAATAKTSAAATATEETANIQVSNGIYRAYSEPMVAINPENPLNLVGGSKFFTDPEHYRFQIGTFSSFDGGCHWTENGVLPGFRFGELTSDVSIAFGPNHHVYVAVLYSDNARDSGIAVSTSTDDGKTFGPPVHVYDDATGAVFNDKPWIAVDRSGGAHDGSVYVVWSYDYGGFCGDGNACQQALGFSRSVDGGATFSPTRQVEGNAPFCTNPAPGRDPASRRCDGVLGAIPAVLPDGTLTVAFNYMDITSSGEIPTRLAAITSSDGGETWATPVLVATISDIYGLFPPDRYRNASLPAFAADPAHGNLYVTWSDKRTGDADILFSVSRDEGQTWSPPLRVNDDTTSVNANQFQPQLAVAPNGVVTISFFDTRRDSRHHLIDVYLAQSVDDGASFRPTLRVTTQSWNPSVDAPVDGGGLQFIGDYQGLAVNDRFAYPFWNDTRTGSQEIFTALVPSARP
jgi:hypothetical protein